MKTAFSLLTTVISGWYDGYNDTIIQERGQSNIMNAKVVGAICIL